MDDSKLHSHNEKEMNSLVQTIHVFREDIGMEFNIEVSYVSDRERKDREIS